MSGFLPTPPFVVVAVCFLLAIVGPADIHSWPRKLAFAGIHGLTHLAILAITTGLAAAAAYPLQFLPLGEILYPIGIGLGMAAAGFVGGFTWGLYLLAASFLLGAHSNDAFSAMRLDWFRHFLRLKIDGDRLTIYPVCIDRSPRRTDWQKNPKYAENDQSQPFLIPKGGLNQHFIEPPIVIDVGSIRPLRQ